MILIGIGANLPGGPRPGEIQATPRQSCEAALAALAEDDIAVIEVAPWYESAPVPPSDQPWYVNGVAELETALCPEELLLRLHAVEEAFGRERGVANAARTLDLDLLDHDGQIRPPEGPAPVLPHPRLDTRAFVLLPLRDVAPDWCHPVSGQSVDELIAALPPRSLTGDAIRRADMQETGLPVPGL